MGGLPSTSVITAPHSTLRREVKIAAGLGQPARRAPPPPPARRRRQHTAQQPHRRRLGPPREKEPSASAGHCSPITATAAALRPIAITTVASASLSRPYRARGSTACLKSGATSAVAHRDGRIFSAFSRDAPSDPINSDLPRSRGPRPCFPNCLTSDDEDRLAGVPTTAALHDASFLLLYPHPDPDLDLDLGPLELRTGSSRPRAASTAAAAASRKRLRTLASHLRHCHRPP